MNPDRAIEFALAYQELEAARQFVREAEAMLQAARTRFREAETWLPRADRRD